MIFLRHYSYSPPVDCRSFGVELAEEVFVAPLDHLLVEEFVLFSCLLPVLELLAFRLSIRSGFLAFDKVFLHWTRF